MSERRLGLFFKPPVPGRVKTRLTPPLDPTFVARLYQAFLEDTIALARRVPGARIVLFNGGEPADWFPAAASGLECLPQEGFDLGERMARALDRLLAGSPGTALLLGTDAPTLPPATVDWAFGRLEQGPADLVLGPVADGGYCLIGVSRSPGDLLAGMAWSTDRVMADTESRAAERGWTVERTDPWYDIDTLADLDRLRQECQALEEGGPAETARMTRHVLRGHDRNELDAWNRL